MLLWKEERINSSSVPTDYLMVLSLNRIESNKEVEAKERTRFVSSFKGLETVKMELSNGC